MKAPKKLLSINVEVLKTLSVSEVAQVKGGDSTNLQCGGRVTTSGGI